MMKKVFRNSGGAAAVEFALVALPVLLFILGIMQTAWIVWVDNLLQISVDAAARCGAVQSTTLPCYGGTTANMIQTANKVFAPLSGASFSANTSSCSSDGGVGLTGTYQISFVFVLNMTVTAKSCYPTITS
jgi:Flp pilus assembly protein TadG